MEFLNIKFTEEDELKLNQCVNQFNILCESGHYPKILEYTHYDLAKNSSIPNTSLWKEFLLNPKIKDWYQSERAIQVDSQVQKLIRTAASSNSTATVQTLNALLQQQRQLQEQQEKQTIIIYNFVPITEEESKNPIINEMPSIPNGIRRAITRIDKNSSN